MLRAIDEGFKNACTMPKVDINQVLMAPRHPAGAIGIAAMLHQPERFKGRGNATVLGGSTIASIALRDLLLAPTSNDGEAGQ
jgi:hypothetical protein